ncbi:patatin-like phospholipase family protein [Odoribacter lunatus]|uniref:patatin-like phospholipase family protein n=1 Tax=Odoribacter lunatus TaxID=2941335 RepID=UPI00203ACF22|nr:patatin-like phospholipase family protein [Odoribacter lunatus]
MWKYCLCILLCLGILTEVEAERKKVGLVLSGGGAKGIAHVGVIEVLEKAGIPVDIVVGTSMGAIVGGLYAIGYDGKTLDSLVRKQDWPYLLSDKLYRDKLSFAEKEATEKYLLSFPFRKDKTRRMPAGFVSGQNIYNLFTDLTLGYHDTLDFKTLPIPFACVAADMVSGKEVVLSEGLLAQAMRSSMAIPGAFTPVRTDSMILVDGGIVNNFPVDVAKAMGADIIIGVDVQSDLRTAEDLNSLPSVMGQLINLMCLNKFEANKAMTDLYIRPDVSGFSAASFTKEAVDTLLLRGEKAAEANWEELIKLKTILQGDSMDNGKRSTLEINRDTFFIRDIYLKGISEKDGAWLKKIMRLKGHKEMTREELHKIISELYGTKIFTGVTYRLLNGPEYDLEINLQKREMSALNLGFRFDSEEMAAILLNTRLRFKALRGSRFELTARLSKSPFVRVDYSFERPFLSKLNLSYMFKYNDFDLYDRGDKVNGIAYRYHSGKLSLTNLYVRNFKFETGLRYEYFDSDDILFKVEGQNFDLKSEGFISYYGLAHLETYDKRYYPTKGVSFKASYSLYTDNFIQYNQSAPFSALSADFTGVVSLTNRLKLLPSVYGRVLIGNEIASPYLNYMGGDIFGRNMAQQLPFWGINHIELFDNALLVAKLHLRQRMGARHYLSFVGNYALQDDNFFDILGGKGIWGGGIGYSYDLPVGPVDFVVSISDWTKKMGLYFNLGFNF